MVPNMTPRSVRRPRRLPPPSNEQPTDLDGSMTPGSVVVLIRGRKLLDPNNRWRLDRVRSTGTLPNQNGRLVLEVESGVPVAPGNEILFVGPWDRPRWVAQVMVEGPEPYDFRVIRAADLWDKYLTDGRPVFRGRRAIVRYVEPFGVRRFQP